MKSINKKPRKSEALMDINEYLDKKLAFLHKVLECRSRVKRCVNPRDGTIDKAVLVHLISMFSGKDEGVGVEFLRMLEEVIYELLRVIKGSDDPLRVLEEYLEIFNPVNRYKALSVSRTCVNAHLPSLTKGEMEELLEESYKEDSAIYNRMATRSNESVLVVDSTHDKTSTSYPNGETPYIIIGKEVRRFERGINYLGSEDATRRLIMGMKSMRSPVSVQEAPDYKPWLKELFRKVEVANEMGVNIRVIESDRGLISSEVYVLAYLGILRNRNASNPSIRVVTPRRHSSNKSRAKWDFLLDQESKEVSIRYLQVRGKVHPDILRLCQKYSLKKVGDGYKFPVVNVALFNEYGGFPGKELQWAKKRARFVDMMIKKLHYDLKTAEDQYKKLLLSLKKQPAIPNYKRGKLRKLFKYPQEKQLYDRLFSIFYQLKKFKKEKQKLIRALTEFTISLNINESLNINKKKFIRLARAYHLRWNIENAFRDLKQKFIIPSRTRKSTRKQLYRLLAVILYNGWQTIRTLQTIQKLKNSHRKLRLYQKNFRFLRKELGHKFAPDLTAERYLMLLIKKQILNLCNIPIQA